MQLTPEQLEKAKEAYERVLQRKGHNLCAHNEEAITAAFAAVEPPQVDVPVVLMPNGERVALEDPRVLGEPKGDGAESLALDNKCFEAGVHVAVKQFLASRRARLLQPKTVEERVTIQEDAKWARVLLDGQKAYSFEQNQNEFGREADEHAEIYRLGLIAKLKAEGTVSGEAGGNAQ